MDEVTAESGDLATSPESPSFPNTLTQVTAFARFEFEPGRGNEGTKILMVEWQDEDEQRHRVGTWHVSWPGKTVVLPADERTPEETRRVYFLLPPHSTIPPHVTLAYVAPTNSTDTAEPQELRVNPLPAIFTPELGATARASGKRGVLHTIWAKKRLQVLDQEIKREQEYNLEGIALDMAMSEKKWIEHSFGLEPKLPALDLGVVPKFSSGSPGSPLNSPRSPGGRRLSEKLKGLSIGTSEMELAPRGPNTPSRESHPLSPESSDVAYSSFSAFHGGVNANRSTPAKKRIVPQNPPGAVRKQQLKSPGASLDSVSMDSMTTHVGVPEQENESELFAKALNPRTPDIVKSPFSFSSSDVAPSSRIKGES